MKKIKEYWNALPLTVQAIAMPVGALILAVVLVYSVFSVSAYISKWITDSKVAALEKSIEEGKQKNAKLEETVNSLSTNLAEVNTKLVEANTQLATANENTANAQTNYTKIRSTARPVFISNDSDGKVAELTEALNNLYPDSTSPR